MLNETSVRPFEGRVIVPVLLCIWELEQVKEKTQIKGMDTQKFIHSVKLHVLHQIKPYSRVKIKRELSDTCISIFEEFRQVRKIRPRWNIPNHGHQYTESHPSKVLNSTFYIKWSLTKIQLPFGGWFTPALVYLGYLEKSGNLRPNNQIHGRVIHSVKIHISHQMKPYLRVKVISGSI